MIKKINLKSRIYDVLFLLRIVLDCPRLFFARVVNRKIYINNFEPFVSLIIPTYNRSELFVARTLPSILSQTYKHFELVVVGDCCDNKNAHILNESARINGFRFINLPERGKYPEDTKLKWFVAGTVPINKALDEAKGEWILYMDDDDVLTPDHIKILVEHGVNSDAEFVSASYNVLDSNYNVVQRLTPFNVIELVGGHATWMYRKYLKLFKYSTTSYKKSWNCPADIDRVLRMRNAGVKMSHIDEVVTLLVPRPDSNCVGLMQHLLGK
jgi:glycosyltransferase involved in cell wall biosynthesis